MVESMETRVSTERREALQKARLWKPARCCWKCKLVLSVWKELLHRNEESITMLSTDAARLPSKEPTSRTEACNIQSSNATAALRLVP